MAKTVIADSQLPASAELEVRPARADFATRLCERFHFTALLTALLGFFVFTMALRPMADPDIFWHLRNAVYLIQTHCWIRQDMFAFTTLGMPWINHEWLAELPFYAAYRLYGVTGMLFVTVILLEIIFLGLFALSRQISENTKTSWVVAAIGALLGTVSYGPRMLLFGWVCLLCELHLIARFERWRGEKGTGESFWPLIPLFLFWVNLHGSWLIGFSLFVLYIACGWFTMEAGSLSRIGWISRERKGFGIILAACIAALFINPYGWRLPAYPFDFAFRQTLNVASIEEWQPLDMQSVRARVLLAILSISFIAQLVRRRWWAPYELAFVLTGVFAAFTHRRFLFLASLITLPYLARDVPWPRMKQPAKERPLLHAALLLLLVVLSGRLIRARATTISEMPGYPVKALPYLRALQLQGRVFSDFLWGGYLELYAPNIPVFIDSRVDIFERRGVLRDYLDATALKNTPAVLDKYSIRYVLFADGSPLAVLLRQSAGWKILYQDGVTILFERTALTQGAALARR